MEPSHRPDRTTGPAPMQQRRLQRERTPGRDEELESLDDRDPADLETGPHPVGVTAGAAAGGLAGAALGSLGGPVGAIVGASVGAVAGGLIGREAAEAINPTSEETYWAEHFQGRPYIETSESFAVYRPAYRFGWEAYAKHAAERRSFDELEPRLKDEWDRTEAAVLLPWHRARPAARDSWNRLARRGAAEAIAVLGRLRHICIDSAVGFHTASEGIDEPAYADLLERWTLQRDLFAEDLAHDIRRLGGEPEPFPPSGAAAEAEQWLDVRSILDEGPSAVLAECERGEARAVLEYQDALRRSLPPDILALLRRQFEVILVTRDQVRQLRETLA